MTNFKIGCSGYQYNEWRGPFYPAYLPKEKWFEFYCEHFNTMELNVTFYKFPRATLLKKWYDKAPDNFTFTVKAPRVITHFKKLKDSQKYMRDFYNAVSEGLREKAGCVLFQFPSQYEYSADRLMQIVMTLDASIVNVLEFRHASWWNEEVYAALHNVNASFCGMSHPALPDPFVVTGSTAYYRFHGVPHLYHSIYEHSELEVIANQAALTNVRDVYILFNNTIEGAAIVNAKAFQEIIELVH